MKCRNCYTGLMATDTCCPACGTTTGLGQAAAASLEARAAVDPAARRELVTLKWVRSLAMLLLGVALAAGGVVKYLEARSAPPGARPVTAADLLRTDTPEALSGWISYSPSQTIDTGVEYVKLQSRQEMSKFVLLQVKDRWLLTKVDARFNGGRVEGRLGGFDNLALPKVWQAFPEQARRLLPYQLDAEHDLAGTQRQAYILGGASTLFSVLLLCSGVRGLVARLPPFQGPAFPA